MPTYEYRCPDGHEFEVFQKMSDDPAAECPVCGAESERLISAGAGLLFKGSGFYITDSRSPDYAEKAKSEGGGSSDGKADKPSADTPKTAGSGDSGGGGGKASTRSSAQDSGATD